MLSEEIQLFDLFDEFYLINDEPKIQPVKGKEILKITKREFTFTGTNKKKTVFVYNDKNQLSDNDTIMLENLVTKGLKWGMEDIIILNLSQNEFATIIDIKDFFKPEQIIFWGCDDFLAANKIPQRLHEVLKGKELKVLTVNEINTYDSTEQKTILWKSIQNLLEIK
jgi:hypothetical protein